MLIRCLEWSLVCLRAAWLIQVVVLPRYTREWIPPSGKAVPDWLRESPLSKPLASLGVSALLQPDAPPSVRVAGGSTSLASAEGSQFTFRAASSIRFVCGLLSIDLQEGIITLNATFAGRKMPAKRA